MSRRACKTCAWWVAGKYEYGICAYTTRHVHHTHWLIDACDDGFCAWAKKLED